jgi:hypothetical protein
VAIEEMLDNPFPHSSSTADHMDIISHPYAPFWNLD